MTGGEETPLVTKEDLQNAENILTEKAKEKAKESLKNLIPAGFVFLEEATETKILDKFSFTREGAETEKFNFQVKAKAKTIGFKKEDIENFAKEFILSQIPQDKSLYRESLKIEYLPETVNFESEKFSLSLKGEAKIYPEIDLKSLKNLLAGKSLSETKIFLENQPQIIRAEIHSFPFWVKSIPKNINKIEIKYPIID